MVVTANNASSSLDSTPVYIGPQGDKQSITLRPLESTPREAGSVKARDELADGKVLISVRLQGKTSLPDIEEWKTWLTSAIPANVADIKIEAVFHSHSALCLMTVPIAVWDLLQNDDAFSFIAFVESNNILNTVSHLSQSGTYPFRSGDK